MKNIMKLVLIGLVVLMVIGTISYIKENNLRNKLKQEASQTRDKLTNASVEVVKAYLRVYYVANRGYPLKIDSLKDVENVSNNRLSFEKLQEVIKNIKSFSYEVRGDRQAYKIIYFDEKGNKIEVEGNYNQEFH